ncbi:MAG: metal ABC transporter substrate-binding protein [Dehalococcoidia bacterium]|nr:metal ABC transporter substrate-binding protein [Dehalococcoidia bacterium]
MTNIISLKKITAFILLFAASLTIISCSESQVKNDSLEVAATIFPVYSIAEQIAGENITVNLLIQPGESPHTFTPSVSTKQITERAQRVYVVDEDFDKAVINIIDSKSKTLAVNTNVNLLKYEDEHDDHDDDKHKDDDHDEHAHGEYDPHYWLSPNAAIKIARNIADDMKTLDPNNASDYEENYGVFEKSVTDLYAKLKTDITSVSDVAFITMHDAWAYFNEAFETNLVGSFEPSGAESPSPKYLAELQEKVDEKNAVAIFSEPQLSLSSIQQFIKDNDLRTGVLDPLGGVDGRMTYQELLEYNASELVKTLR